MTTRALPTRLRATTRVRTGLVFISPGALGALRAVDVPPVHFLMRHIHADWGSLQTRTGNTMNVRS